MMPVMDGFDFLTALRERPACRQIPVIVVTAKDLTADDQARLHGRVAEVVEKNAYTSEQLSQRLREAIAACGGDAGPWFSSPGDPAARKVRMTSQEAKPGVSRFL
jgi:response regulator RpfG family c-di-GMP phosphodiesterase